MLAGHTRKQVRLMLSSTTKITGNGEHTTYKNGDDWGMDYYCFNQNGNDMFFPDILFVSTTSRDQDAGMTHEAGASICIQKCSAILVY